VISSVVVESHLGKNTTKSRGLFHYNLLVPVLGRLVLAIGGAPCAESALELLLPLCLEVNGIFSAVFDRPQRVVIGSSNNAELQVPRGGSVDHDEETEELTKEHSVEWGLIHHQLFRQVCADEDHIETSQQQLSLLLSLAHSPMNLPTFNFCARCACVGLLPDSRVESEDNNQNDIAAVNWWRLAANQGDPEAILSLGIMYQMGRGVQQSLKKAIACFEHAISLGSIPAMVALGLEFLRVNETVDGAPLLGSELSSKHRKDRATLLLERAAVTGHRDAVCLTTVLVIEDIEMIPEGTFMQESLLNRAKQAETRLTKAINEGDSTAGELLKKLRLAVLSEKVSIMANSAL